MSTDTQTGPPRSRSRDDEYGDYVGQLGTLGKTVGITTSVLAAIFLVAMLILVLT